MCDMPDELSTSTLCFRQQEVLLRAISFIACMGGKKLADGTAPYAKKVVKAIGNMGYLLALLQYSNEQISINARRLLTLFNQG